MRRKDNRIICKDLEFNAIKGRLCLDVSNLAFAKCSVLKWISNYEDKSKHKHGSKACFFFKWDYTHTGTNVFCVSVLF